jgi:tetratricopeptide (TPR) repeat protein
LLVLLSWRTIQRNGVWENELVFYETTARASPKAASIWNNLGTAYGGIGRTEDAMKAFEVSVAAGPNSEAFGNLGRIYASQKRFSDSEAAYLKAVQLNPRNANNYSGLGDLYFARRSYGDAIPLYEKSLEMRPGDPRVSFNLVDACRMEKRFDEALAVCRQVAALGPQQAKRAYRTMAGIYAEQGLQEKAAEADRMSESIPLAR